MLEFDKVLQKLLANITDESLIDILGDLESAHNDKIASIEREYNDKIELKETELSNVKAAKELADDKIKDLKAHNYELFSQLPGKEDSENTDSEESDDESLDVDPIDLLFKE